MQEPATDLRTDVNNQGQPIPSNSYAAMILSAILPGLGQLYLNQFLKGFFVFIVFISALGLFYINSYPVREWRDLLRFQPAAHAETLSNDAVDTEVDNNRAITIWTLDNGKTLMFSPNWILKITATIQAIICWIYAVCDGWRGRRNFSTQ